MDRLSVTLGAISVAPLLAPHPAPTLSLLILTPPLVYAGLMVGSAPLLVVGVMLLSLTGPLSEIMYGVASRLKPGNPVTAGVLQTTRNILSTPIAWTGGLLYEYNTELHVALSTIAIAAALIVYGTMSRTHMQIGRYLGDVSPTLKE
jgi:hypothetical protein